jgi:hypothetical protein
MTRVCLVGNDGLQLSYELLSRETAREALAAYDLREPYHNSVAVQTVSLGAAVALLNDLDWYLVRFVSEAMVFEPSVSEREWLSRDLAMAIRDETVDPGATGRLLKLYGLEYPDADGHHTGEDANREPGDPGERAGGEGGKHQGQVEDDSEHRTETGVPRLVEPMFVARTGGGLPEYDLRDVEETLLVRVTEDEFNS